MGKEAREAMRTLLLLHGAIGSKQQFQQLSRAISHEFNVYGINFSGHGGELIPEIPFSIDLFVNDVVAWMNQNKIQMIDIFGYSMGGYVALCLALKFPNRVGKIATLATKFNWNEEVALKESKMLDPEKIQEKIPAFATLLEERHAPVDWKKVMSKTADMMLQLGFSPLLTAGTLSQIKHSVRLMIGDKDNMVSVDETRWASDNLSNGSIQILSDVEHPIEKKSTQVLLQQLDQFF